MDVNGVDLTNAIGTKSPYPLSKACLYDPVRQGGVTAALRLRTTTVNANTFLTAESAESAKGLLYGATRADEKVRSRKPAYPTRQTTDNVNYGEPGEIAKRLFMVLY